eukprot:CAMPEP_0197583964 /NCGR_PEP_ID=MMETSP1326-20131121/6712_1 /TAXON_ID=1155430 /ORGANISM="Genus nov. species nov., Strain RCC2288" /LENGTH=445 /DNA_ID=CAMNT_0043148253 /DNA_START=212 /DNA_END=1549 /DNA_ORIENTATION=-
MAPSAVLHTAAAPSWVELKEASLTTSTGKRLAAEDALRAVGEGNPHISTKLRLFNGDTEADVRVTLYRDHAAWCPYCQKVWMLFEEKQISYKTERINMRSYGEKPAWFLKKVPSGLLPVIELDGKMLTESLVIMQTLDQSFSGPSMLPEEQYDRANKLLRLERQLFSDWCGLVFRASGGSARRAFEETFDKVDAALGELPGPWFLGGDTPSIVDLQYVSHIERMNASCLYWKGMQLRGTERWANIERWFLAFEQRPSYHATKSDYYTHIMDIPPQYGPGISDSSKEVENAQRVIDGVSSWKLPLHLGAKDLEPLPDSMNHGDEAARHEAAYAIAKNAAAIARFACRGAGQKGAKQFSAPLADPTAVPNLDYESKVDELLRVTVSLLLDGSAAPSSSAPNTNKDAEGKALGKCLGYLRDRVGVPRDMSYPAAMQLRAHLNHIIDGV